MSRKGAKPVLVTEQFWADDYNKLATTQLGVPDDWVIFFAASTVDIIDDEGEENHIENIQLPKGYIFVGVAPLNKQSVPAYGIIKTS